MQFQIKKKGKKRNIKLDVNTSINKMQKLSVGSNHSDLNAMRTHSMINEVDKYENGLFKNFFYYMRNDTLPFTVGQYSCDEVEPFCGFKSKILWSEDFHTLNNNEWISEALLDTFMITNWKKYGNFTTLHLFQVK